MLKIYCIWDWSNKTLNIGIFGGTFNPIHYGHLINCAMIKDDLPLEKIIFLPSKMPVHKNLKGNISPEDRYEMIKLAVKDNSDFDVSRIEIDRTSKSYTVTTLKQLIEIYRDDKLFFILGIDALQDIGTWKDYEKILGMVSFIVMKRAGIIYNKNKIDSQAKEILFYNNPIIEISSQEIRKRVKCGKTIKYLVHPDVEKYIINKELYKN